MTKLSIADLEKRAESVASQELLDTIAGGNTAFNACHNNHACHSKGSLQNFS